MSVSLRAKSRVEDVHLSHCSRNSEAISEEQRYEVIDNVIDTLYAHGFQTFIDLFLREKEPFIIVANIVDKLEGCGYLDQERINRRYDEVAAVLFSGYHPRDRSDEERKAIYELVLAKKAVDSSHKECPVRRYWQNKSKKCGMNFKLDEELDFKHVDLTSFINNGEEDSNQNVKVVHISERISEFYILSDSFPYLPDKDWNKVPEKISAEKSSIKRAEGIGQVQSPLADEKGNETIEAHNSKTCFLLQEFSALSTWSKFFVIFIMTYFLTSWLHEFLELYSG